MKESNGNNKMKNTGTDIIYEQINRIIEEVRNTIYSAESNIKEMGVDIDKPDSNIGIILHNKLNEIRGKFNKAGMDLFTRQENNFMYANPTGYAIIDDIFKKVKESIDKLKKYSISIAEIAQMELTKDNALMKMGPLQKFWFKFRARFNPQIVNSAKEIPKEKIDEANKNLAEYEKANNDLWMKYNFKENIVPAFISFIMEDNKYLNSEWTSWALNGCMIPDLEKLELSDLIPKLKMDLKTQLVGKIPPEEFKKIFGEVPDVGQDKNEKMQNENISNKLPDDDGEATIE